MNSISDICIVGPTASGKTKLAVKLAEVLKGGILSLDSRQVYKGLDIGTGKDLEEYIIDKEKNISIPHFLIDIVDINTSFTLRDYYQTAKCAKEKLLEQGLQAIWCGGTGLYIESLIKPKASLFVPENIVLREKLSKLDKAKLQETWDLLPIEIKQSSDNSTCKRMIRAIEVAAYIQNKELCSPTPIIQSPIIFAINTPGEVRRENIANRLSERIHQEGMIQEVKNLIDNGANTEWLKRLGLEYKWVTMYLLNEVDEKTMLSKLQTNIQQFSKRQMTWFRGMERRGFPITWIDYDTTSNMLTSILKTLELC